MFVCAPPPSPMSSSSSVGVKSEMVEMLSVGEDVAEMWTSTNESGDDSTLRNTDTSPVSCKAGGGISILI